MDNNNCYHCGDDCGKKPIIWDKQQFCCDGCKTVYEIFQKNDLSHYYEIRAAAGASSKEAEGKYDFLAVPDIVEKLLEFNEDRLQIVNLYIPHIHCSSCIWILENLNRLQPSVLNSQVDFPKKTVRITYKSDTFNLQQLVLLLARIGYEPYISLEDHDKGKKQINRDLIYKLGVAGFAFGNVMFLSFPEYLDMPRDGVGEYWLEEYKGLFRGLMFAFSLPVVFYAAQDYFISAYKGLRSKILNMDVPIALGIMVLFLRSSIEIMFNWGSGFFDSLTGLVFFLLIGKFFQQKTYAFLSFERDYKSYFPIAVTKIDENRNESSIQVYEIKAGDTLLIRNQELIPVDGILVSGKAKIDYSFVTGESQPTEKAIGDRIFAGGKQMYGAMEMKALKSVSQSYLTQLWSDAVFKESKSGKFQNITDRIGKRFTIAVLSIAFAATTFWIFHDPKMAINVLTAVLIIACPCAIALAAPFTLGNMLRIFGRKKLYLKDAQAIERLAQIDTAIFDKTGTLTSATKLQATYEGMVLTKEEESLLKNTLRASNHPLSRSLYALLAEHDIVTLDTYEEHVGKGIEAGAGDDKIRIGSAGFAGGDVVPKASDTAIHITANNDYKGCYVFNNHYREGLSDVFLSLSKHMQLVVLSGDNAGERSRLQAILPTETRLIFNQKPEQKLSVVRTLQALGKKVLMVGDGLNDAGALMQSHVGIAISEDINVFSPACDGILDASKFKELPRYMEAAKSAMKIINFSFMLSLMYNVVGLYFAVTGQLQPVIAAILMPLSSISIVAFTTLMTNRVGSKLD
ncbi:heavy metal translocating P-type ATPase metal-binding domain-containing protein [Arenibacter sp. GZD96]|uniref:heavy metal translocating P-type ATPase n=1 Tax=Aurantibrevibacter litoralis TaxID=3106030 RepID=UPI002AFF0D06|nr:heavy metal translocating P-type ATPase metal-binding domain-containing protein [Arenibacter sp. GZD-96]MEA1785206.1 heavy metal translocating P-type ATPase metal-binding domain-containing protein [Arenibacter sp. GZD-96]